MTLLDAAINTEAPVDMPFIAEKTIRRMPVKVEPLREPLTASELFVLQRRFDQFISQLNSQGNRNWTDERRSPRRRPKRVSETHGD